MPDKPEDRPSLEMPSFSLRQRKKKDASGEDTASEPARDLSTPEPQPEPHREVRPDIQPQPEPPPEPRAQPAQQPVEQPGQRPVEQPRRRLRRRPLPVVRMNGLQAAILAGVAVGALALLLAWLAGVGCEAVRGTSACGGGPGLLILLVVLAVLAWEGTFVLRALGVPHAGSTSLLAVGILAVLVLVFLLDSLDEAWALVTVPVASVLAHAVSWWVTATVGDDDPAADSPARSSYDVR